MSELPRYTNCPICAHYHTTYPYCDMCKDGNRFKCASIENRSFNSIRMDCGYLPKKLNIGTKCLICGEPVPMKHMGDCPKICEKCKEAVMFVRRATDDQKELRKNRLRWARDVHKLTHPDDDMSDWPDPDEME